MRFKELLTKICPAGAILGTLLGAGVLISCGDAGAGNGPATGSAAAGQVAGGQAGGEAAGEHGGGGESGGEHGSGGEGSRGG